MTVSQKVGQCLVLGFTGTLITPAIIHRIRRYTPAGIRVGLTMRSKTAYYDPKATSPKFAYRVLRKPYGTIKDFLPDIPVPHCTAQDYCEFLNVLKTTALQNDLGIPIHITCDMEGDGSADFFCRGMKYFPSMMGIGFSKDPQLAYDVALAVAKQLAPIGFHWIHSPVADTNTNHLNPEIGTRSFSDDFSVVSEFSVRAFEGLKDGGLIATGKHFPGRGESSNDAHSGLPAIDIPKRRLDRHIEPFAKLVQAGIPAIMSAHTMYPALDNSGRPASLSKTILTDLLKNELKFGGVVTTDDITMGGIVEKYEVADACIEALNAGNDLILFRDESALIDEVFPKLVRAVEDKRISQERLNDAVRRTLRVKAEYGLFKDGGIKQPSCADAGIRDRAVEQICLESARRSVNVLRCSDGILPVGRDKKVLLIEQVNPLHKMVNDQSCHPAMLWEKMLKFSDNVYMVEVNMNVCPADRQRVLDRLEECEIIVATNYYYRDSENNTEFLKGLLKYGKPLVVVTNSPYSYAAADEFENVIVTYSASPEAMEFAAEKIFVGPVNKD